MKDLVSYQEPIGGNCALHLAVLRGNKIVIDILVKDFMADPLAYTMNGLGLMHCAA